MASWRDAILREFPPGISRLTLVADPDGLLVEEGVLQGVRERSYELIPFEDHVAFRYAYESRFRSRWDRGESTDLVVVLRAARDDLSSLPYDLLKAGRKLSFNLGGLFPNLSYPVVAALGQEHLDALYRAQEAHIPGVQGENATKDFVLRHVFEMAPELVRTPSDLLRDLLRRHYRRQHVPSLLDERVMSVLRQSDAFRDWPLEKIVPDPTAFFAFLQERWPVFLDRVAAGGIAVREDAPAYGMEFEGPVDIPFDHDDVRVFIDTLFVDGILKPVAHAGAGALAGKWVSVGIARGAVDSARRRLEALVRKLPGALPGPEAHHADWFRFAYLWAECRALAFDLGHGDREGAGGDLRSVAPRVAESFGRWVDARYHGLHNHPAIPPVMLHHVPRFLASLMARGDDTRIALVVMDGLALDQWIAIRRVLVDQIHGARFDEDAVLAWVPTITSVCRQALFAGRPPLYLPDSIHRTDHDQALWRQFWSNAGLDGYAAEFLMVAGDGPPGHVDERASDPRLKALGIVVEKVDRIMHGMELGAAGMHNQVRQWASEGFLAELLRMLLDRGFHVYVTSDHGNVEVVGCGQPREGATADSRGQRARVYPDEGLRSQVCSAFDGAREWPSTGLPEGYFPLIAPEGRAFAPDGLRTVAHGGASMEELIVPFVRVTRRGP